MKLKPYGDRIVVERHAAEEKSPGGIVLPDKAKEKPSRGKVLAVGPGRITDSGELITIGLAAGDEILFGRYSGHELEVDGRELLIINSSDVLATL